MNDTQLEKEVGGLLISAGAKPETAKRAAKVIGDGIRALLTKERDLAAAGALLAAMRTCEYAKDVWLSWGTARGLEYASAAELVLERIRALTTVAQQAALDAGGRKLEVGDSKKGTGGC